MRQRAKRAVGRRVWSVPQTVMPGRVAPFSGPITCTMPGVCDMNGQDKAA